MKKKLWIAIVSLLTVCMGCFAFAACGEEEETPDNSSSQSQGPTWEDEIIVDQEHGGIELPEVERP